MSDPFPAIKNYVPASRKSAEKNVAYITEELESCLAAVFGYARSEEEIMAWVKQAYDRTWDSYMDYLSTPHD